MPLRPVLVVRVARDWRPLVREIEAAGYTVEAGGRHLTVRNAEGKAVHFLPSTPSDHRGLLNNRAELRRKGIIE